MNTGVQEYLNRVFAADGAVTKYSERLQFIGRNHISVACDETLGDLREECIRRNLEILSGDACVILLATYTQYFQYDSDVWDDWNMGEPLKYLTCLDMICIMQDAEYRLRFKYKLSKFELLEVCRIPEHDGYDDTKVKEIE